VEQENECDFSGDKVRTFENNMIQIENGKVLQTSDLLVKELFKIQYGKY
jgi:hypothetical protein